MSVLDWKGSSHLSFLTFSLNHSLEIASGELYSRLPATLLKRIKTVIAIKHESSESRRADMHLPQRVIAVFALLTHGWKDSY